MTNLFKNKGFLLLLTVTIVIISAPYGKNISAQTPQTKVKDFKFNATVDCNLNPIEEISTSGIKSLTIYSYPVEFLAKSVTYDNDGTIVLHDVFLYKITYNYDIYSQPPYTKYFDPAKNPENFFQSVTIRPPSKVTIKKR